MQYASLTFAEVAARSWEASCASSGEYYSLPDNKYLIIFDDVEDSCPGVTLNIVENSCD